MKFQSALANVSRNYNAATMSKSLVFHCTWLERNETSERIGAETRMTESESDSDVTVSCAPPPRRPRPRRTRGRSWEHSVEGEWAQAELDPHVFGPGRNLNLNLEPDFQYMPDIYHVYSMYMPSSPIYMEYT